MTQINRNEIEDCIFRYVKDVLKTGKPSYNEEEIKDAIKIFYDFNICKLGYAEIDGFSRIILKPLQNLSTNNIDLEAVRTLSTSLEPFIKRIIVLLKLDTYNNIKPLTLIPLLKILSINSDIKARKNERSYPILDKDNLDSYKNIKEYLEYLCLSYMTRNEVHNACNWSVKETAIRVEATLVVYIYIILFYKEKIKPLVFAKQTSLDGSILDTQENKWLYDFISYGRSANELKTQVVDAFILNLVFDNNPIHRDGLETEIKKQFNQSISNSFLTRRIFKLQTDHRLKYENSSLIIYLTEHENDRISKVRENFRVNKDLFLLYFEDIVEEYNIKSHKEALIEKIKILFTENYNLDLLEVMDQGDNGLNMQYQIIANFINDCLFPLVSDKNIAERLMKDLLNLCIESDFLISLSASSVLSNITNTEKYQNYINQPIKKVFLDTQIALYSLCLDFKSNEQLDDTKFRITKELCSESLKKSEIKLYFSSHYIAEISYQLKNALGLIVYERILQKHNVKLSTNIFYQFYEALKLNSIIEEDYYLEDFLEDCFSLYESDLYDSSFFRISENNLRDKFKELNYIEVIDIPECNNLQEIEKLIELTIEDQKLPTKTHHILKNDAIMLSYLSNSDEHLNAPFFLTWDKSFIEFRKVYNSKYLRRSTHRWHIFSPSKFINYIALLHMQIDPKSINDDFLSVMNSFGLTQKTKTIYDTHNRFLDIRNITREKRYKYINILNDLFNDKEFSYEPDEQSCLLISNYDGILDTLNQHFYNNQKFNISQYRLMLLDENYFIEVAKLIKSWVININEEQILNQKYESFLANIDQLMIKYINEKNNLILD